jgi:hypothetical protein
VVTQGRGGSVFPVCTRPAQRWSAWSPAGLPAALGRLMPAPGRT